MGVSLTEPSHQASHSLSRVMSDGADWFETFRQYEKPSRNTREKRQRERHSSNSLSPKTVRTLHPAIFFIDLETPGTRFCIRHCLCRLLRNFVVTCCSLPALRESMLNHDSKPSQRQLPTHPNWNRLSHLSTAGVTGVQFFENRAKSKELSTP